MKKLNCWEFKKCGRESQGSNTAELGVCPAYEENKLDGVHGGKNAGRSCWVVAGTLCGRKVHWTYAHKERYCMDCDFFILVHREESDDFLYITKQYDKQKVLKIY
jgi:hypothetical protein